MFFDFRVRFSLAIICLILATLMVSSCATNSPVKPSLETEIPEDFHDNNKLLSGTAVLPAQTLELLEVVRNRAELRKGPAITYDLENEIANKGDVGILLSSKGVWKKVYWIDSEKSAWVHGKATAQMRNSPKQISVDLKKLPVVAAYKPTSRIYDYSSIKRIKVDIPKGTTFIVLKKHKWRLLVWLPQTNTLAWVAQRDFR